MIYTEHAAVLYKSVAKKHSGAIHSGAETGLRTLHGVPESSADGHMNIEMMETCNPGQANILKVLTTTIRCCFYPNIHN